MNTVANNTLMKVQEEMKMANVMVRTKAFKTWAGMQMGILDTFLSVDTSVLNYWLSKKELIREDDFNKRFQMAYERIKEVMEDAVWWAEDARIPTDVLEDALNRFKERKSKVRKTKAEYKQAFDELREAIRVAKESTGYVDETSDLIQELVIQWRDTHEIIFHLKDQFVDEGLRQTVKILTDWLLSTRLYPSEGDIKEFVENYMKTRSVRAA